MRNVRQPDLDRLELGLHLRQLGFVGPDLVADPLHGRDGFGGVLARLPPATDLFRRLVLPVLERLGPGQDLAAALVEGQHVVDVDVHLLVPNRLANAIGLGTDPLQVEHG